MAVKDLVGLYESRTPDTTPSSPPNSSRAESRQARRNSLAQANSTSPQVLDVPAPSPARFISHPLLRRREPSTADQDDDPVVPVPSLTHDATAPYTPLSTEDDDEETVKEVADGDVVDELLSVSGRQPSMFPAGSSRSRTSRWTDPASITEESSAIELQTLLPGTSGSSQTTLLPDSKTRRDSLYQAETASFASTSTAYKNHPLSSSTVTLVQPSRVLGPHTPVPLSQILARNAAPVSLPQLDDYIASLDMPNFPVTHATGVGKGKGKGKAFDVAMFPPLERLNGTTMVDLENNWKIPPAWRNRDTIFSALLNVALGVTGSSAIASFYSIQGLVDTLQIFALLLSTFFSHGAKPEDQMRTFFLQKVPNVLAFNFASTLVQSLILLVVFMIVAGILLYVFMRMTAACCSVVIPEGLQSATYLKHTWLVLLCSFVLTVIYLPLSTMAVHVLVWSDDLWVVPNPYTNATTFPPEVTPLGPPEEYRDPLDFCYTTTMLRNEVNYAPVVVIIAIICFLALTIWYPIHLHRTIRRVTPKVDRYTELGALRSQNDMDREYQRLLSRDKNPLSFLYGGFRRGWATYESTYLFAKLTTLLLTAVINPDNCVFRNASRDKVNVARQILLLIAMLIFFGVQCVFAPFLDPVNNASEWFSRLNYVLTSAASLAVALNIPGQDIFNGPVLYIIYIVTYGLSFYFIFINMARVRRLVKRLARRLDFSIDIFSPRLDLSSHSPHTKRRIWQEAITTLLLTDEDCHIPKHQKMEFKQARHNEYPPYLLGFEGTPAERHVENLKILREVGSLAYHKAVKLVSGPDYEWFHYMEETIQKHFVGPDCYWKPHGAKPRGCTKFFGSAWWVPFPPTLVIQYDDGPELVLSEVGELERYLQQNSREDIMRKRQVRMALRALDGQYVRWPYDHVEYIGDRGKFCCCGKRYGAKTTVHYQIAKFELKRNGHIEWEGLDLGSGFDIQLTYAKDVQVGGNVIGLTDDYDLNQLLAHFLSMNENLIPSRLSYIEAVIHNYRQHYRKEFEWKKRTLSYRFLSEVYDHYPHEPRGLCESAVEMESDPRVRKLMAGSVDVFGITYERMAAVSSSELATWWYIFWDDLWRRNWETISAFRKYETEFNPHYPTSIAYTPLPRAALENFLTQRGLLHKQPKFFDFFHAGFLNKIYLRMNDIVFHGSNGAIIFHLGDDTSELDMEDIDLQTLPRPSTLGTGGGTEYDDESIRARPAYRWEGILDDPLRKRKTHRRRLLSKLAVWFGVSPLWRTGEPSQGLSLDVRLEHGKYVLLGNDSTANGRFSGNGKGVEGKSI
ncbi:hypothetical protein C8T65DRAFT_7352 [Cerioporus squamosus]|nr:hypothetical protein C8T65DRAFT_7352 [Cerioporus squamosus]